MTVTDTDMDRNDYPDVSQQPLFGLAPQGFAALAQYGAAVNLGTTTVTGVDMNRNHNTVVLQQPQCGLAPQGVAALAQYGAPVNMGMTTMTGGDMNCDGIPNLLQQPQSGLPTMTVTQGDLTTEEREELEDQLIAVRNELLDRDEDPELVDLVYQLLEWLYDADTPELADDARATIPHLHHLWCGTRNFDLTIDDSDEGEDYGIAALIHPVFSGVRMRELAQDRTTPKRCLSWWCHPLGHVRQTRGADRD